MKKAPTAKVTPDPIDFSELNSSELRAQCEQLSGRHLSPWIPREVLLEFLREGSELPSNQLDDVRMHQMTVIADNYASYKAQLPMPLPSGGVCSGGCFDHCDIQVIECQISTPQFRHHNYSENK